MLDSGDAPFSEPVASTSRAVLTLPHKPADEEEDANTFTEPANLDLYTRAWSTCNAQIQTTLSSLHDASLDQIVAFVHASDKGRDSLYAALSGYVPLPTGLIIGASPGSSSLLYSSLIRQLAHPAPAQDTHTRPCLVSRLSSRDCSNIKNALRSLIGGFVGSAANVELEEDDEDEELDIATGPATLKSALLVPEDMLNLTGWYEHRFGKQNPALTPTLAILLEDLEAMDGKVLTQLIETLSRYTSTLPLVLLVGIATTSDALYNLVPRKTCNKLDAQSFFVEPGVGAFNALVRGLLVDWQAPLALAPRVYNEMWRAFEDLHRSIDATISLVQYLYMNHFTSNLLAALTLPVDDPSSLSPALVERVRSLPSLAASTSNVQATLLSPSTSPADFLSAVNTCRSAAETWHAERSVAFEALLATMEFWDKRKPMETCLAMVLGEGSGMGKVVDELCALVLQASSSKLPNFLRHLTSRLSSFLALHPTLPTSLSTFLSTQLSALSPILAAPRPAGRANLINTNLAGQLALPAGFPQAHVAGPASAAGVQQVDREFSGVAKETAEGLKARLRSALKPCTELLLHELWFSDDSAAFKRFHPAPFPALLRTLQKADPFSDPSYAPPLLHDGDADPPAPLDLAVAYRTYAETHPAGRLANLGEWWAAFELQAAEEPEEEAGGARVVKAKNGKGKGKKRARRDEEEDGEEDEDETSEEEDEDEGPQRRKQARFLRAVGDLAHLGFIHPTTYKPEHVLKSVY
ncbi:hypothetical protein JCM10207_005386 [Rhodosporidiobolus poonsookiae]